jgi:hypothetical protein
MPSLVEILLSPYHLLMLFTQFLHTVLIFWNEVAVLRHFVLLFFGPPLVGAPHWDTEGEQPDVLIKYITTTFLRAAINVAAFDVWVLGTPVTWTKPVEVSVPDTPVQEEEEEVKDAQESEGPQEVEKPGEPVMPQRRSFEMIVVCGDGVIS